MKTTKKIEQWLDTIDVGSTFKYDLLPIESNEFTAAAKTIERLIIKNKIKRISKGLFYKPEQTPFGELKPSEEALLKPYLFKNGKRVAYITGNSLYNRLGLTTQVSAVIKIASRGSKLNLTIGTLKIKSVKSYVDVTDENYRLLEILDILKDFNKISDIDRASAIDIIFNLLKSLSYDEQKEIIKYALSYPPRVKAFLGTLCQYFNLPIDFTILKNDLNPLSKYRYDIKSIPIEIQNSWNLI